MSAIFLLPVSLTCWPRKNSTRADLHVDNSQQAWSWYDHPLPSYSVFVCWYVTWHCDHEFSPVDLEQLNRLRNDLYCVEWGVKLYSNQTKIEQLMYMAGHVTNLATKLEDPIPICSRFMTNNVSRWLPLTAYAATAHATNHVTREKASKTITFLESPTQICLFTMQLRWLCDESNKIYLRK